MRLDEWNARYASREEIASEPAALLVDAASELPPGRALDLACGAGRNALWLASRGWEVTAIDGAEEAIRLVREHDATMDARVLDLALDVPLPFADESFDLVAILYYLHRPLFAEAKRRFSSTLSKLTPITCVFFALYSTSRSRNPEPSRVQPGVSAFG